MSELKPGLFAERSIVVQERHTAAHLGSGGVSVYATPMMALNMEEAARDAVQPHLEPGMSTVGTVLDIRHLAPTPMGMRVTARATLTSVEGRTLVFKVEAFDETEKIGEGSHVRAIIDIERFLRKIEAKSNAASAAKSG